MGVRVHSATGVGSVFQEDASVRLESKAAILGDMAVSGYDPCTGLVLVERDEIQVRWAVARSAR